MHAFPYTRMPFPHYYACVISRDLEEQKGWGLHVKYYCMYLAIKNKCEKHFIKMLKDVEMTMLKCTGTRCSMYMQAKPMMMIRSSMKAKGKGWACNNHNMRNPSLHLFMGLCMLWLLLAHPLPLPSCCSVFSCHHHCACYTASCSGTCSCTF